MHVAITSIQRNRNPWIVEWLAFHLLMGFTKIIVYVHKSDDGMTETLNRLMPHYPIEVFIIHDVENPQLAVYQHSWTQNKDQVDWMAFIDGDEFLFSPQQAASSDPAHWNIGEILSRYADKEISALGVFWMTYGGNGHVDEPAGLIVENYPRHSHPTEAKFNWSFKSIVKGGQDIVIQGQPHLFATRQGTFDERLRPLNFLTWNDADRGSGFEPSREILRLNHYSVQSWEYFKKTKQSIGFADINPNGFRPDRWYHELDRNECDDGVMYNVLIPLKLKVREMREKLG